MNKIYYLWNFKMDEKQPFPNNVIKNNLKFVDNYEIINPSTIEPLLINEIFPDIINLYKLIPHWIIKTDLARLLIIYFQGGIYSDSDCFINKKINSHNENNNVLLFTEHICDSINKLGPRECKNPENVLRVANFYFGSKNKHHPFFKEVIDECINRLKQLLINENKKELTNEEILWVCGPDVITTIYHRTKNNYKDIFLYDLSYLSHKCHGSWR